MSTIDEIERAIEQLPAAELAKLRAWFDAFEGERLDSRIEADAAAGKLDTLAEAALAEFRRGQAREL